MYLIQEEKKKKREREQSENTASAPVEPFTLPKPVEVKPSKPVWWWWWWSRGWLVSSVLLLKERCAAGGSRGEEAEAGQIRVRIRSRWISSWSESRSGAAGGSAHTNLSNSTRCNYLPNFMKMIRASIATRVIICKSRPPEGETIHALHWLCTAWSCPIVISDL